MIGPPARLETSKTFAEGMPTGEKVVQQLANHWPPRKFNLCLVWHQRTWAWEGKEEISCLEKRRMDTSNASMECGDLSPLCAGDLSPSDLQNAPLSQSAGRWTRPRRATIRPTPKSADKSAHSKAQSRKKYPVSGNGGGLRGNFCRACPAHGLGRLCTR